MRLAELTEPFLQYLCRLNRSSRKGAMPPEEVVRHELQQMLSMMRTEAMSLGPAAADYTRIEPALVIFADSVIRESRLPYAPSWEPMALDLPNGGSDQVFFEILDACMASSGEGAKDTLTVLLACLGLGFTGGQRPEAIRARMVDISAKLRGQFDADPTARVCPEAYEHADTTDLTERPGGTLVGIGILLVGLIAVLFGALVFVYLSNTSELRATVQSIAGGVEGGS